MKSHFELNNFHSLDEKTKRLLQKVRATALQIIGNRKVIIGEVIIAESDMQTDWISYCMKTTLDSEEVVKINEEFIDKCLLDSDKYEIITSQIVFRFESGN